jgi:FtsZ-binding cell division protein ZapB
MRLLGMSALFANTTGEENSAGGGYALCSQTTGNRNSALGYYAGSSNATGSDNVFLGYNAGYNETGSNKLYILNSRVNTLIYGEFDTRRVGINTTTPGGFTLAVNGSAAKTGGGSWSSFSDARLKEVHGRFDRGLSEVTKINPVRCSYRPDNELKLPPGKEFIGLVAQEVRKVVPEAVQENSDGYLMVNNDPIIWTMVNAIKELREENDQLRQRVQSLEKRPAQVVKDLRSENESLRQSLAALEIRMDRMEHQD